ncbi:hypothetical protein D3C81_2086920 [compost metagenome]
MLTEITRKTLLMPALAGLGTGVGLRRAFVRVEAGQNRRTLYLRNSDLRSGALLSQAGRDALVLMV